MQDQAARKTKLKGISIIKFTLEAPDLYLEFTEIAIIRFPNSKSLAWKSICKVIHTLSRLSLTSYVHILAASFLHFFCKELDLVANLFWSWQKEISSLHLVVTQGSTEPPPVHAKSYQCTELLKERSLPNISDSTSINASTLSILRFQCCTTLGKRDPRGSGGFEMREHSLCMSICWYTIEPLVKYFILEMLHNLIEALW